MKKLGFTLAEVLITLVIIGVIAAMTVPTLMNNTNSQEFRSALKKAISSVNQALTLNYALTSECAMDFDTAPKLVDELFAKRMSIMQNGTTRPTWSGTDDGACAGTTFATADGILFCIKDYLTTGTNCDAYNQNPCGTAPNLLIDVNGQKGPNKMTANASRPKDIYAATIYSQRVIPYGDATQQVMYDAGSVTSGTTPATTSSTTGS